MHSATVHRKLKIYPQDALYIVTFILFYFQLKLHVIFIFIFTNPTPETSIPPLPPDLCRQLTTTPHQSPPFLI